MMPAHSCYVFGPVPSRRLGLSLGVDLVPFKTCTHDCLYCQLGRTTDKTVQRTEYVPVTEVLTQVETALTKGPRPDVITLAGSGEPTLHSRLGRIVQDIKRLTEVPLVILTNGSLFDRPEVRRDCVSADIVIPSLDAGTEETFQRINRPAAGMTLAQHVEGLVAFRDEFPGRFWLEVMLVEGVNTSDEEIARLRSLAERVRPDRIQLNTVVRPPAERTAVAVGRERLMEICRAMGPPAEIVGPVRSKHAAVENASANARCAEDVLAVIQRHPCTAEDVAAGLGITRDEAARHLERLLAEQLVDRRVCGHQEYYEACV